MFDFNNVVFHATTGFSPSLSNATSQTVSTKDEFFFCIQKGHILALILGDSRKNFQGNACPFSLAFYHMQPSFSKESGAESMSMLQNYHGPLLILLGFSFISTVYLLYLMIHFSKEYFFKYS